MKKSKIALCVAVAACLTVLVCCKKESQNLPGSVVNNGNSNGSQSSMYRLTNGLEIVTDNTNLFVANWEIDESIAYSYTAALSSGICSSTLEINSQGQNVDIVFQYDFSAGGAEYGGQFAVIDAAEDKKGEFTSSTAATEVAAEVWQMVELIAGATSNGSNTVVQSICYQNAIMQTIKRSFGTNGDCNCNQSPYSVIGWNGFTCAEDILIRKDSLVSYFDRVPPNNRVDSLISNYVDSSVGNEIPFADIWDLDTPLVTWSSFLSAQQEYYNTYPTATENSNCLRGSDLGCCGNYSGCCILSSTFCFIHDVMCIECNPRWFCLPGCIAG